MRPAFLGPSDSGPRPSVALPAAVLAILAACALIPAAGCGVSPATYCYTAASATVHAVDTGMSVAGDLYRQGKLSESAKGRLVAAHDVYRPAAKAVVDGCRVVANQDDADAQIRAMEAAGAHVIEALTAAGVK